RWLGYVSGRHCEGAQRPWQSQATFTRLLLFFESGFGVEVFVGGDGLSALDLRLQPVADLYWFWPLILLKLLDHVIALGELPLVLLEVERDLLVFVGGLDGFDQILVCFVGFVPAGTTCGNRGIDGRHGSYF